MSSPASAFKQKHDFASRQSESRRIRVKHEDRVPIICERDGTGIPEMDRKKFLVPNDLTVGQFLYVIRQRIGKALDPGKAIFLFCRGHLLSNGELMSVVDQNYCDDDGFIYIQYTGENAFG